MATPVWTTPKHLFRTPHRPRNTSGLRRFELELEHGRQFGRQHGQRRWRCVLELRSRERACCADQCVHLELRQRRNMLRRSVLRDFSNLHVINDYAAWSLLTGAIMVAVLASAVGPSDEGDERSAQILDRERVVSRAVFPSLLLASRCAASIVAEE